MKHFTKLKARASLSKGFGCGSVLDRYILILLRTAGGMDVIGFAAQFVFIKVSVTSFYSRDSTQLYDLQFYTSVGEFQVWRNFKSLHLQFTSFEFRHHYLHIALILNEYGSLVHLEDGQLCTSGKLDEQEILYIRYNCTAFNPG